MPISPPLPHKASQIKHHPFPGALLTQEVIQILKECIGFRFSFPINLLTTAIFKYKVKHMVKLGTSTLMVFRLIFLIIIKKIK